MRLGGWIWRLGGLSGGGMGWWSGGWGFFRWRGGCATFRGRMFVLEVLLGWGWGNCLYVGFLVEDVCGCDGEFSIIGEVLRRRLL